MSDYKQKQLISYLQLRALLGLLGITFPVFLLVFGNLLSPCSTVQDSLSSYYFTNARDVFVGLLFITGTLFLTYRGYNSSDHILATIAGLSAIGIAVFPMKAGSTINECNLTTPYQLPALHYISAGIFFTTLIIFSLFVFTKTSQHTAPTPQKRQRNKVYKICGYFMIFCLFLMVIHLFINRDLAKIVGLEKTFIFVMEWLFLTAFGISWITKGEYILKDKIQFSSN